MNVRALVSRYALFAVIATVANLASQRFMLQYGSSGANFGAAIVAGTFVGLFVKYYLDKRWIFYDAESGIRKSSKKFTLYVAMGVVTTAIFWGIETAFWLIWETDFMRELGAVIGLGIGYFVKYRLDSRFVFTPRPVEAAT
ncbi:GtrA family protein [Roseovarius faecimaris]|uniref:GtrA family protein n=1 Tax=Roseovarius faecimaris TaxID=2494550 RepID=A0A6I6ISK4_9RHOB|nr:GtrA family protein [Roseovarius faecimaris]QGX98296.1 GtrA family protein [Roseovarius faecimaris]